MRAHVTLYLILTFIFLQLSAVFHCGSAQAVGKAESCEAQVTNPTWNRMEVLPGTGWDNLRNMDMGLVFEYNYTQCQLTTDRKFLLPDGFFAIPVQDSDVETYSEIIDHWENHTSLTANSVNVEVYGFYSDIEAKFSSEYTKAKTNMYNENQKSVIARVQIRHKRYIVRLQSGTKLNPMFKTRLLDIAAHVMNNNSQIAHYLSELLVRDYGTHYLTAAHAGGILVLEDYIRSDFASKFEENRQKIAAYASANFYGKIGFSTGFIHLTDEKFSESYLSNRTYSHIRTIGGPPYRINFTIDDWEDGLADTMVAIDREGVPLHFAIIPEVLTELPPAQTLELAHYVEKAINSYYKHNTLYGCTNPDAKNFYFGANIDDGSCKAPSDNFTFGGVYQTCSHTPTDKKDVVCPDLLQKNPLTGNYSCPHGYEAILLHSGTKPGQYSSNEPPCKEHCYLHIFKKHCYQTCTTVNNYVTGSYQMYWCVAVKDVSSDNSGYLFGGYYSSRSTNPLTGAKTCPNYFIPVLFGDGTYICVSDDHELGKASSIPFAGFESCSIGNPLAARNFSRRDTWPHKCPTGYTQHLVNVEQTCEINYCVKAGTLIIEKGLPAIKLPPYRNYPTHNLNTSSVRYIVSDIGQLWEKHNETNEWKMVESEELDPDMASDDTQNTQNSQNDSNSLATAALIVSFTALLGLLIAGLVCAVAYKCKGRKTKHHENYMNLEENDATNN